MSISVRSLLELEIFKRAGARVRVGGPGLDRQVRWVHMGEVPDIASFLVGGELLLTAGLGMGHSAEEQRRYVASVAEAGIAVLVVEAAGRAFSRVPEPAVDAGQHFGLPIVELAREIRFVDVTAEVHSRLLNEQYARLEAAEAIGRQFIELLLTGADAVNVVEHLAKVLDRPVVLEDAAHQVVTQAPSDASDFALDRWDLHSRHGHDVAAQGFGGPAHTPCRWQSIVLQGESWGRLHVLDPSESAAELTATALDRAAAAVSIALLSERAHGVRRQLRHHGLLTQLRSGELTGQQFADRARALGFDWSGQSVLVFEILSVDEEAAVQLQRHFETRAPHPFIATEGDRGERLVCITTATPDTPPDDLLRSVPAQGVRAAGVSRIVSTSALQLALDQARQACMVAAGRMQGSRCSYDHLGVGRLLAVLGHTPELATFVEDELGALLNHDAHTTYPLLPTLRIYLDSDGNKAVAAHQLHIQRRTLYNRLARIIELVGPIDGAEERAELLLAVRALDLLADHDT